VGTFYRLAPSGIENYNMGQHFYTKVLENTAENAINSSVLSTYGKLLAPAAKTPMGTNHLLVETQ
jgi:hypothetical protein